MKKLLNLTVAVLSVWLCFSWYSSPASAPGSSIYGMVWNDLNRNGIRDQNEPGVDEVTVRVYGKGGALLGTQTTRTDLSTKGIYSFQVDSNAEVYLEFDLPRGFIFTLPRQGQDNHNHSQVDPFSGKTPVLSIRSDRPVECNAGLVPKLYEIGQTRPNE